MHGRSRREAKSEYAEARWNRPARARTHDGMLRGILRHRALPRRPATRARLCGHPGNAGAFAAPHTAARYRAPADPERIGEIRRQARARRLARRSLATIGREAVISVLIDTEQGSSQACTESNE